MRFSSRTPSLLRRTAQRHCYGQGFCITSTSWVKTSSPLSLKRAFAQSTSSMSFSSLSSLSSRFHVTQEIQDALRNGEPVVALESTIVAHGMPYPQNYTVALNVEDILRSKHVVPATIALCNGHCHVGLSPDELHALAEAGSTATKVSTRELSLEMSRCSTGIGRSSSSNHDTPPAQTASSWGATTVASTMTLANAVGIPTFVTGGIGGVHRYAEHSMDISTDLTELSRTPVIVISAGIKSILDIPKTLEVLETLGVPVVTMKSDDFPAFFSPTSGCTTPWRMDTPMEVAEAYWAARDLNLHHGMLVAVPPPQNDDTTTAGSVVEDAIQRALQQASEMGIEGSAITPFVLKTVAEQTKGESLHSNIELVLNNAHVGADIALAIAECKSSATATMVHAHSPSSSSSSSLTPPLSSSSSPSFYSEHTSVDKHDNMTPSTTTTNQSSASSRVVVLGGAVVDIVAKPVGTASSSALQLHTSNPGVIMESDGGVGRNVAEVLAQLNCQPLFYTAIGNDARGKGLIQRLVELGGIDHSHTVDAEHCIMNSKTIKTSTTTVSPSTATYAAVLDHKGDLHTAIADMHVLDHIPVPSHTTLRNGIEYLVLDSNAPPVTVLQQAAEMATHHCYGVSVCWEPTSVPKANHVLTMTKNCSTTSTSTTSPTAISDRHQHHHPFLQYISYAFPNEDELYAIMSCLTSSSSQDDRNNLEHTAQAVLQYMHPVQACLVVTLGANGVLLAERNGQEMSLQHIPIPTATTDITSATSTNTTGAGDSLCGAFLAAKLHDKTNLEAVQFGMEAAKESVMTTERAVSPHLTTQLLHKLL